MEDQRCTAIRRPVHNQRREQQQPGDNNIDSSARLSLAAMSTTATATSISPDPAAVASAATATSAAYGGDDVSSMGDNTTQCSLQQSSLRKLKDDCGGSRCTVTSEESERSRSQRRRPVNSRRRWLEDRKATLSGAPNLPQRSADGPTHPPGRFTVAEGCSQSLRRLETAPASLGTSHHATRADARRRRFSGRKRGDKEREVSRCQSMTQPPVRPVRNDSQSDLDILSDNSGDSEEEDDDDDKGKKEFDPDMFARLLKGQEYSSSPTNPTTEMASHPEMLPPKRPRRSSDADVCYHTYQQNERWKDLLGSHGINMTGASDCRQGVKGSCEQCNNVLRDNSAGPASPGPPAQPLRTSDKLVALKNGMKATRSDAQYELEVATLPLLAYVSGASGTGFGQNTGTAVNDHQDTDLGASTQPMEMEDHQYGVAMEKVAVTESKSGPGLPDEEEEDLTVSSPASGEEYDADLFARLLSGDASASPTPNSTCNALGYSTSANLPVLVARVSNCATSTVVAATNAPAYNRFNNHMPFKTPEHSMKSVHPPLRPRRSFDPSDQHTVSLASIAAAACRAQMEVGDVLPMQPFVPGGEALPRPISLMAGKRRAPRRSFSRRQTLPLVAVDPDVHEHHVRVGEEGNDPTKEAGLVNFPSFDCPDARGSVVEEQQCTAEGAGDQDLAKTTPGSYLRILPIRRRMVRRFTMPSKGGGGRDLSPISKKPRLGRSMSCHSTASDESMKSRTA